MKKLAAASAALIAAVAVAGCTSEEEPEGRTVSVHINGASDEVINKHEGTEACEYFDGVIRTGDRVVLKGADGGMLGVESLTPDPDMQEYFKDSGTRGITCGFDVEFTDVDTSQPAYSLEVADYPAVPLSRTEVERDLLVLHMRGSIAVMTGQDETFEVYDGGQ